MSGKLIIINTHPIQYFAPLYQAIARAGMDLELWFIRNPAAQGSMDKGFGKQVIWDIPLLEGYTSRFLHQGRKLRDLIGSIARLPKRSTVVVYGWNNIYYLTALLIAKYFGHRTGIRTEHPMLTEKRKKPWVRQIRYWSFRLFLSRVIDHFFYIGQQNAQFYRAMGIDPERMFYTPYSVDNARFEKAYAQLLPQSADLRADLGIPANHAMILFSGKLQPVKRVFDLLEAFRSLAQEHVSLVLVGDGPLRQDVEIWIRDHGLANIHLAGFVNQSRIPEYYVLADVLVLCSESETWGLSVNEGMLFKVPAIVSDTVGCAPDLVIPGQTGYVFPKGDIPALRQCLQTFLSLSQADQEAMRQQAFKQVSKYSYEQVIAGFQASISSRR